jgi:phosphatidylserine/phosphatidylglycerophosphate/cardiolipin synthase-like enzyme
VNRVIRKSHAHSASEVLEMLGALFSAELVDPSRCIWLVSPWVSDVEVLDNSAGMYSTLSRFGRRPIRLVEVLVTLATAGTSVVVVTTPATQNDMFLRRLEGLRKDLRVGDRIRVVVDHAGKLHTKALTGDDYAVAGSMNITYTGIHLREEQVELRTDESYVAQARMDAFDRFGGVL